ncbi:MAG: PGF-pre-PGF domain-containing protein [Nanoarchaeota archaeon]|nr:PGF-pre-PGF domain-containing protein [Nanoarchaeota archaeon]
MGKGVIKNNIFFVSLSLITVVLLSLNLVSATTFEFNGTVVDIEGNALNNSLINITIRDMNGFSIIGYNSTTTNATGWFNISVSENETWMYGPKITWTNSTTGAVEKIGQGLPTFPQQMVQQVAGTTFYLKDAGTINITAINSSGDRISFRYQIKDQKLGYPLEQNFDTSVSEAVVNVPRERNYSIMIFPDASMPVSFNWNNFSSEDSYNITASNLSFYNFTTKTLRYQFNTTMAMPRVSGYINYSGVEGWDEFTVIPYLLEPGNMVHSQFGSMPHNLSGFVRTCGLTETINETNAYINETGYQLLNASEERFNYEITSIWDGSEGEYNVSVLLGNVSINATGVVFNTTDTTYSNVSLSYTHTVACSDDYNLTSGFYNITLPATLAETSNILLFATARNGSNYYGGFRNISGLDGDGLIEFNFSNMAGLFGVASNVSMETLGGGGINISTAKHTFNIVNSTNSTLNTINAHIEIKVDYSSLGAIEFTWMNNVNQGSSSVFTIPLLNSTGIKEMNIFAGGGDYAPVRKSYSVSSLVADNAAGNQTNITLTSFNPGDIEGSLNSSRIFMALTFSNSTCSVPLSNTYPDSCFLGGLGGDKGTLDNFNPMKAVMGGAKLNFIMGKDDGTGNPDLAIIYVNVDLLASGPPNVAFDSNSTESTGTGFSGAMRFGSGGPTIYDYVLIGMPYTEGNSSQTGLNESGEVNVSIPIFYDESWNVIWDSSSNGTNGTNLAGNNSHYSTYSDEWETLMSNNTCHTNISAVNSTNPCYIDTTMNMIWIRLPHFSGTQPSITGNVITASEDSSSSSSSSSSSGSGSSVSEWAKQKIHSWAKITPGVAAIIKDFDLGIGIREIHINVNNEVNNVKITVRKYDGKPANVSVEKTGKINQYLEINIENLNESLDNATIIIRVEKSWFSNNSLEADDVTMFKFDEDNEKWNELVTSYVEADNDYHYYSVELTDFSYFAIGEIISQQQEEGIGETNQTSPDNEIGEEKTNLIWLWIVIAIIMILVLSVVGYKKLKN